MGALPGLLIVGGAWLLLGVGVITADQSQAAFIGVPLTLVGGAVGAAVGAAGSRKGVSNRHST